MAKISEDERVRRYAHDEMRRLVRVYQAVPEPETLEEAAWWGTIVLALNSEEKRT